MRGARLIGASTTAVVATASVSASALRVTFGRRVLPPPFLSRLLLPPSSSSWPSRARPIVTVSSEVPASSSSLRRVFCSQQASVFTMGDVPVDISNWRRAYLNHEEPFLLEENLPSQDPLKLFDLWFKNMAAKTDLSFEEINAVCVSTVSASGMPSSRVVLLRAYNSEGFSFYTNYTSRKGQELAANPNAAMLFYWPSVHRQIRIEGKMEKLPIAAADAYWKSRPLASRIGSKSSEQSKVIPSRQFLLDKKSQLEGLAKEQGETAISRPEDWGGYILKPAMIEFWQGQSDRLHDRIVFSKKSEPGAKDLDNGWHLYRLSP